MDDNRWREVRALFAAAAESGPSEREAVLAAADPDLRREVESLLAAHDGVGAVDRLAGRIEALRSEAFAITRPVSSLDPGRRLGRHEIRGWLGAGGMGEVYRAFDTRLRREVAIKVLGRHIQTRPGALQRFEKEARAASALNHPNIATVYDIGEEDSLPYIVMELVEGESLRRMLSRPWPLELMLDVGTQIAEGLVAAHERDIVHRDLKPENVLLNGERVAKIVDFGLAEFGLDAPAEPGIVRGTLGYLPPEALTGEPVDPRADQFSFGAILYEMATGVRAFPLRSSLDVPSPSLAGEHRPLADARPDLPAAFVQAVSRCMRSHPNDRFPSMRDLLAELRGARRRGPMARPGPLRLPARRTRLIGRRGELVQIEHLVLGQQARLLTLTGTGGTGKTRLAIEAAERLAPQFLGGVTFVPLATITDPALVATTIAQALEAPSAPARPALAAIISVLRGADAPTLLVLDNFEQVIDAAPTVSELLAACPELTVIVTSREILHLYGEHGFPVSPLELPDGAHLARPEALGECPSVSLFVERAQAANAGFRLTAENAAAVAGLCAGLDGLPLALELAAAQTRVLPPEILLARVENRLQLLTRGPRDLPGRQQTLRRTIDWSHQLLSATEQAVFRRLSVFAGGLTLEAAQAVVDPFGKLDLPVEQGVSALVDKSLLEAREPFDGESRFIMLETLREYAREKLVASEEAERTQRAHAAYFLILAEEGGAVLASAESPESLYWLRRFEVEHDNVRVALEHLTARGDAEWGFRLALGMFPFWQRGTRLVEGRRSFDALLEIDATRVPAVQRAKALFAAGVLAGTQRDPVRGNALHQACLALYRQLGDRRGTVIALVAVANQLVAAGDPDGAQRALEESLDIWIELGDRAGYARSLSNLAFVAREQRRLDEARSLYQQAASLFDSLGDRVSRAWAGDHEGDVAREQGDLVSAEALYAEALQTFRAVDDSWGTGSALADLGAIARLRGDGAAGRLYREALASFVKLDHRRGIARVLESLACLAAEGGQSERGIRLLAAATALRERIGAPPVPPADQAELDHSLEILQECLGLDAARCLWQEGARMSLEETIRLAADQ